MSGVKTIKHRTELIMKKHKVMSRENVNRLFTGGESEVGFIAYKEHPSDRVLTVFVKYPNGAEYCPDKEMIIRTPHSQKIQNWE